MTPDTGWNSGTIKIPLPLPTDDKNKTFLVEAISQSRINIICFRVMIWTTIMVFQILCILVAIMAKSHFEFDQVDFFQDTSLPETSHFAS